MLPVVESGTRKFVGMISLRDLLRARVHSLREEHHSRKGSADGLFGYRFFGELRWLAPAINAMPGSIVRQIPITYDAQNL